MLFGNMMGGMGPGGGMMGGNPLMSMLMGNRGGGNPMMGGNNPMMGGGNPLLC